jgi:hypothetical protein
MPGSQVPVARMNRLSNIHTVDNEAIEQHREGRTPQHGHDEIGSAKQERHPDRQQDAVRGIEGNLYPRGVTAEDQHHVAAVA